MELTENGWVLLSTNSTAKFGMVFVLTRENDFSWRFYFKANRKTFCSSKKRARDFKNSLSFKEFRMFLCENHWDFLNVFNTLTLKKVSEKVKHF